MTDQKKKLLSPRLMKVAKIGLQSGYIMASEMADLSEDEIREVKQFLLKNHPAGIPPTFVKENGETVIFKPGIVEHDVKRLANALAEEFEAKVTISKGAIVFEGVGREAWGEAIATRIIGTFVDRKEF